MKKYPSFAVLALAGALIPLLMNASPAMGFFKEYDLEKIEQQADAVIEKYPAQSAGYELKAAVYFHQHKYDRLFKLANQAAANEVFSVPIYDMLAQAAYLNANVPAAYAALQLLEDHWTGEELT